LTKAISCKNWPIIAFLIHCGCNLYASNSHHQKPIELLRQELNQLGNETFQFNSQIIDKDDLLNLIDIIDKFRSVISADGQSFDWPTILNQITLDDFNRLKRFFLNSPDQEFGLFQTWIENLASIRDTGEIRHSNYAKPDDIQYLNFASIVHKLLKNVGFDSKNRVDTHGMRLDHYLARFGIQSDSQFNPVGQDFFTYLDEMSIEQDPIATLKNKLDLADTNWLDFLRTYARVLDESSVRGSSLWTNLRELLDEFVQSERLTSIPIDKFQEFIVSLVQTNPNLVPIIKTLIDAGMNVNIIGPDKRSLLYHAAMSGDKALCELLINKKADLNGPGLAEFIKTKGQVALIEKKIKAKPINELSKSSGNHDFADENLENPWDRQLNPLRMKIALDLESRINAQARKQPSLGRRSSLQADRSGSSSFSSSSRVSSSRAPLKPVSSSLSSSPIAVSSSVSVDALVTQLEDQVKKAEYKAATVKAVLKLTESIFAQNPSDEVLRNMISFMDSKGRNLLMYASSFKSNDILRRLLSIDRRIVDSVDQIGSTALMQAVANGNVEGVEVLLLNGADKTLKDVKGKSAIDRLRFIQDENIKGVIREKLTLQ